MTTDQIKTGVSLVNLLENDGHELRRAGNLWKCRCPFHDERTPSFTVYDDGRFKCFGCGEAGDVIDYIRLRDGLGFREACARLGSGTTVPVTPIGVRPKPRPEKPMLTLGDVATFSRFTMALASDPDACAAIAASRGWQAETIRDCALSCCLGYDRQRDALVFLYPRGVKVRAPWKQGTGRKFIWEKIEDRRSEVGLWRSDFLGRSPRRRAIITEGETDCISLLDAGAEDDGQTLVVAMPNCETFNAADAPRFVGKDVTLALDGDVAGECGTVKTVSLLRAHARSVRVVNWKEVA
jgi:hypothetical protein